METRKPTTLGKIVYNSSSYCSDAGSRERTGRGTKTGDSSRYEWDRHATNEGSGHTVTLGKGNGLYKLGKRCSKRGGEKTLFQELL